MCLFIGISKKEMCVCFFKHGFHLNLPMLSLQFCSRKKTHTDLAQVKNYAFKYKIPVKFPGFQSLLAIENNNEEK